MLNRRARIEDRCVQARVLLNPYRAITTISRSNQTQTPAPFSFGKRLLFITRREAATFRQNPDLQQMHRLAVRRIELAVRHTAARRHALLVTGSNHGTAAHAV